MKAYIKVICKAPRCAPELRTIPNTLEAMQDYVGGYIEAVTFAQDAAIICNEEGRLMGMPFNTILCGRSFVGPILIVGVDGDEFADVPCAEMLLEVLR